MRVSQKLEYASRALLYLARRDDGRSVARSEDIAAGEGIPPSFLAQILNQLKKGGLVTSRRGKTGGWRLADSPSKITMQAVVEVIEPELFSPAGQISDGIPEKMPDQVWDEVRETSREVLSKWNLETMTSGDPNAGLTYHI